VESDLYLTITTRNVGSSVIEPQQPLPSMDLR